jgi:hypothetical protein
MSESTRHDLTSAMLWIGRVLGYLVFGFLAWLAAGSTILIFDTITKRKSDNSSIPIGIICITLLSLSGLIISWWKKPLAAILLFLSMVGTGMLGLADRHSMWIFS